MIRKLGLEQSFEELKDFRRQEDPPRGQEDPSEDKKTSKKKNQWQVSKKSRKEVFQRRGMIIDKTIEISN